MPTTTQSTCLSAECNTDDGVAQTQQDCEGTVCPGNPCRVIRPITEEDAKYWSHQLELTRKLLNDAE